MKTRYYSKITSKGQTTIPSTIRDALNADAGDTLTYVMTDDETVHITKQKTTLEDLYGSVKPKIKGIPIEEQIRIAKEERILNRYKKYVSQP